MSMSTFGEEPEYDDAEFMDDFEVEVGDEEEIEE